MRKLLNTLFVLSEDSYLSLENENVVVLCDKEKRGQYPLSILESILCFSYKGASPALMGACADRGISLSFFTPRGKFLARTCGEDRGNVLLRKQQYRVSDDDTKSCMIARNMIFGKVFNSRWTLERFTRDHTMRVDVEKLKSVSKDMYDSLDGISKATDLNSLRGMEGNASSLYFSVFDDLILNQKDDFYFRGRNKRPPLDNVNAMLSFAYTLLANDCGAALEGVGLDSYVGFMHRDRPGRASLALDLEEELRSPVADRLVLSLINKKIIQSRHFVSQQNKAVILNDDGRKIFLNAWQEHKREEIKHPFLQEKISWGLVPYVQALLLARYLRQDIDGYPMFLWK
ncbi:MAG: type I-C CRISPR-associated endonuclease Cas1 [Clostridia bacterium]|nr:type I-C CRISPR-associated endonuclease Cas1 [Clostridia bacterium]